MPSGAESEKVGVVVIGRNEGERLRVCLESVIGASRRVVYVDSGSTDDSAAMARGKGVEVINLDMSMPFTAARARNEGFKRLRELELETAYVQFVDGDCEIDAGWLEAGATFLHEHTDVAVVCGRLRERFPQASVYNMLCDIEWQMPAGEGKSCGGNSMMRAEAFEQAGGFRMDLIAGEEPELCVRLRGAGWRVWHLDAPMALHDAAMTRFGQWWRRAKRAGYASALGRHLHGAAPERHRVREWYSAWVWAVVVPLVVITYIALFGPWGLLVLLIYPLQIVRLALRGGRSRRENWWQAIFLVLGKFPEALGQLKFLKDRYFGGKSALIEYK